MRTEPSSEAVPVKAARTPLLQRKCACGAKPGPGGGECAECRRHKLVGGRPALLQSKLQANARVPAITPAAEAAVQRARQGGGRPLDSSARDFMEARFGQDFSAVRLHTDSLAADSASAINAKAYTVGEHVVFGRGRFAPASDEGRWLLAHELAHVVQQRGGPSVPEVQLQPIENEPAALPLTGLREFSVPGDGEPAGSQVDAKQSRPSGTIARYNVNKNGKILGWNMDHVAREVYQALNSSKNAYIQINGYYPYGETEFDPTVPINVAKRAIVAWLGVSKIPDLDQRIVTYYGRGGPFANNIGGEIDIRVAYSSLGPGARALGGPSPESIPSERPAREPEEDAEKPDHKGELETKLKLVPLEVSIPYEGGKKKYKQKLTLEIAYELPPIKQLSSRNVEISLGQFELGGQSGVAGGRKAGEKPKTIPVAELGVSVTIIGVKVRENLAGIPSGMKFELGLGVTGDIVGGELEVTGEFSIKSKSGFVKLEFDRSSAQFAVGFHFDVAKLFKPR